MTADTEAARVAEHFVEAILPELNDWLAFVLARRVSHSRRSPGARYPNTRTNGRVCRRAFGMASFASPPGTIARLLAYAPLLFRPP
jgi:hypothetical protein